MKGRITIIDTNNANTRNKNFKNNASIRSFISKINIKFTNNSEDLDIFVSMYNKLEYSKSYPMISGSLWIYHRDEANDDANGNNIVNNYRINNTKTITSRYLCIKKIIGSTPYNNNTLDTQKLLFH